MEPIRPALGIMNRANPSSAGCHLRHAAFTLTEIIVALVILVIIVAFLLPATLRQKKAGESAACIAKLKNLAVASLVLRNDNNDRLNPPTAELEWRPSRHFYNAGLIASHVDMMCPSITVLKDHGGDAWYDGTSSSSDYNRVFYKKPVSYGVNTLAFNRTQPKGYTQEIVSYKAFAGRESKVPFFFCARAFQIPSSVWVNIPQRISRFAFPHQKCSHVLFLDGHIASLDEDAVAELNPLGNEGKY